MFTLPNTPCTPGQKLNTKTSWCYCVKKNKKLSKGEQPFIFQCYRKTELWKGCSQHPLHSKFKKTVSRQEVHTITREISDRWKTLTSDQQNAWNTYATYSPSTGSGYKAYFANNMRLRRPSLVCLAFIDDITSPPESVTTPSGICAQFMSLDSYLCIGWSEPLCINLFMQAFNWNPPGRFRALNQPFKYTHTVPSSDIFLSIDTTSIDKLRHSSILLRSLNLRGEYSNSTDITDIIKSSWPPGRYGIGRYAYSVYGPTG
jgi:hypothetical protein